MILCSLLPIRMVFLVYQNVLGILLLIGSLRTLLLIHKFQAVFTLHGVLMYWHAGSLGVTVPVQLNLFTITKLICALRTYLNINLVNIVQANSQQYGPVLFLDLRREPSFKRVSLCSTSLIHLLYTHIFTQVYGLEEPAGCRHFERALSEAPPEHSSWYDEQGSGRHLSAWG